MDEKILKKLGRNLTIRNVLTHCTFWMGYACIGGFAALYLEGKGFSSTQVGIITAIGGILSVGLQPLLAALTEGKRRISVKQVFTGTSLLAAVIGLLLLVNQSMAFTALLFVAETAVIMSNSAVLNSQGMEYVNLGISVNYGLARGAGSMAYAAVSLTIGFVTERFGEDVLIIACVMFTLFLLLLLVTARSGKQLKLKYGLEGAQQESSSDRGSMRMLFGEDPGMLLLLLGFVCLFMGHFMTNTYLINLVGRFGGTDSDMGIASACAAMLELPSMMLVNHLLKRVKASSILRISGVMFTVKAAILLAAVNMPVLLLSQICQFGAYAFFTPASVYYINERVSEPYKVTGQAALGMATMGLGGTLGNLLGGRLIDVFSVVGMVAACVIFSVAGTFLVFFATGQRKKEG